MTRIAVHILTTKLVITMTTNIRAVSAPDLSVDNDVINLGGIDLEEGRKIAGVCWTVRKQVAEKSLIIVLDHLLETIRRNLPEHGVWLLVGNSTLQKKTRIVKYRGLWGALAARGIIFNHANSAKEVVRELPEGLRFFGSLKLFEVDLDGAAKALLEEVCSYIFVMPSDTNMEDFLESGWTGDFFEDAEIVSRVVSYDGMMIKRYGQFDDEEKGVVGVGSPRLVSMILM